jgi:hypothetical protein
MHGEQHFPGQDEGHRDHARWAVVLFQQEVGAQVQVAVFRFVVAGGSLNILDFVFARQDHAIDRLDPGAFVFSRVGQVNPHRLDLFQVFAGIDGDLVQPAVL